MPAAGGLAALARGRGALLQGFLEQLGKILGRAGNRGVLGSLLQLLEVLAHILETAVDLLVELFQPQIEMSGKRGTFHCTQPGKGGFTQKRLQKACLVCPEVGYEGNNL